MRRLVLVVAMMAGSCCSWAMAAPFDRLSEHMEQYEPPRQKPAKSPRAETRASYQQEAPLRPEPQPVPAEMSSEPYVDEYGGEEYYGDDFGGGCCDSGCCGVPCDCAPFGWWGRAEYLAWWVRGSNTPPLVTTSPDGTPVGVAGVLPSASVVFGNQRMNGEVRSGGRFTLGCWLDNCGSLSVENTFLFVGNANQSFTDSSSGSPILARPFFNTTTNQQDAILLAYPQTVVGSVNITSGSQLLGNEINVRKVIYNDCCGRVDVLAGYRFFNVAENLQIGTNTTSVGSTAPNGTTFNILDSFYTRNNFNGGQLGLNSTLNRGCWTIDILGKIALGSVSQSVAIDGSTVVTAPGQATVTSRGGILALPSNIGSYNRNSFGVLPEFGVNLHYRLNRCWQVNFGYTLLVLTNVVRPGDQIDLRVDPNQFPPGSPGPFPRFGFQDSDVWLQGINVGLELNL